MKIDYWQSFDIDCCYHVYNRAVENENLFSDDLDYINFLNKYRKYLHPYFKTYAYCLMPNHFHFIIKVRGESDIHDALKAEVTNSVIKYRNGDITLNQLIGDQLRRMLSSISLSTNNKYQRRGPLFTPGVKRVFINNDDRLRYLIAYVHHNPIHHGFESDYSSWKFGSFNSFKSAKSTLLDRTEVFHLYQGLEEFELFHTQFKVLKNMDEIDAAAIR